MSNYEYRAVGDDCDAEYSPSLGTSAQPLRSEPRLSFKTLLNKQKSILYPVINSLFCLFVGLLIGYYVGQHTTGSEAHNRHLLYSPANEAVSSNVLVKSNHGQMAYDNPYMGFPSPASDKAWMDLLKGYAIRLPKETLEPLNRTSIPLSDGSGDVWVALSVYHHLHCLDSIRHQIAGVGCATGDPAKPKDPFPAHIDHCIETLRQRTMCQPDVGVRTLYWNPDNFSASASNNVDSECVDWTQLQIWAEERTFYAEDKLIIRPDGGIYNGPYSPPPRCSSP